MATAPSKRVSMRLLGGVACALVAAWSLEAAAQRLPMTRQQIIDLVTPAVGHGYHWGGSNWTLDGTRKGACILRDGFPGGCPDCDFRASAVGADCAGFVGKAWQLTRPSTPEEAFRPYGTASVYYNQRHEWVEIDINDLQPGDALASSGHTLLFDSWTNDKGKLQSYEAMGCKWNIVHGKRTLKDDWIALRRLDLVEPVICKPDTCNSHGSCADGRCACAAGYAGDKCERCSLGFVGFPVCVAAAQSCAPQGTLDCEQSFTVSPALGQNQLQSYACNGTGGSGNEVIYQFAPQGSGTATVSTSSGTVLALRGACSPEACVAANGSQIQFDYAGGEPYFVVVESAGSAESTLRIDCQTDDPPWIGDACNDDADCVFTKRDGTRINGSCYRAGAGGGFCTSSCTRGCPDLPPNKAGTFCIADPADTGSGMCVAKSDRLNGNCARVPGTAVQQVGRFQDDVGKAEVCAPSATPPACEGTIAGTITSSLDGLPIPGADIEVAGVMTLGFTTNADGAYESTPLACGLYTLAVTAAGHLQELVTANVSAAGTARVTSLQALADDLCVGDGSLQANVFDGISAAGEGIAGANVALRRGVDTERGDPLASVTTAADGSFEVPALPSGNYTAVISAPGYARATANLVVCGGESRPPKPIGLTPSQDGVMRIVLEWDRPDDLDLHLQLPNGEELFFDERCRGDLSGVQHALLDVDRQQPTGPETLTIERFSPGLYTLFVHNYSAQNEAAPEGFGESGARIVVLGEGDVELARYAAPSGDGVFWDVFKFEGADPGTLIGVQELNDSRPNPYDEYSRTCGP